MSGKPSTRSRAFETILATEARYFTVRWLLRLSDPVIKGGIGDVDP
jgi:hypothetical protein